jgi:hypothetical protein
MEGAKKGLNPDRQFFPTILRAGKFYSRRGEESIFLGHESSSSHERSPPPLAVFIYNILKIHYKLTLELKKKKIKFELR